MFTRLTHSAIALAITVLAYQAYVLALAPWVEPPAVAARRSKVSAAARDAAREAPHRYRDVLAAYFPADHWSLQQPPIAFENGEIMVVLDDFHPAEDGKIRVEKCAVLFFPGGRNRTAPPPRNAIILEPAEPAVLQTDDPESIGLGRFGKLERGWLTGEITIRSDMNEPGPEDDLLVTTRDLYINEDLIRTTEPVEFRLGRHSGHGRGIEFRMLPSSGRSDEAVIGGMHGFESLEIASEVSVEIAIDGMSSAWTDEEVATTVSDDPAAFANRSGAASPQPPVRVTCSGPFRFEFADYKASFEEDVLVRQLYPTGQLDQLDADLLHLYFDPSGRRQSSGAKASTDAVTPTPARGGAPMDGVALATIEAIGLPVRLEAPSRQASLRCGRMLLELDKLAVTLELPAVDLTEKAVAAEPTNYATGSSSPLDRSGQRGFDSRARIETAREGISEVSFRYRGAEVHAAMIRYEHPPENASRPIGQLWARGDGWLRSTSDARRPHEALEVDWKHSMQLARHNGQSVLSLYGRPTAIHPSLGKLWADQLHLYLLEEAPQSSGGGASADADQSPASIVPDRLVATGKVAVDSAELNVRVNTMALWFDYPAEDLLLAPPGGDDSATLEQSLLLGRGSESRRYRLRGDVLNMQIDVRQGRHDVSAIRLDGEVEFEESPPTRAAEPPLRVLAQSLRVDGADTPSAEITIEGPAPRPDAATLPEGTEGLAEISVRGSTLWAKELKLNRGSSEAWIRSPGQVRLLMDRDLSGAPLSAPAPLWIAWQESMHLLGDRITFLGDVNARTAGGELRTRRLVAQLTSEVRFDGASQARPPELVEVICSEGVVAQFEQRDDVGPTSQQLARLQSLSVNLATGDFVGQASLTEGLGLLESVHLARGDNPLASIHGPDGRQPQVSSSGTGQKLRHLRIEFARGLQGNLHRRQATVFGNVRTLYGPIDSWEQRLSMDLGREPGPNEVWITSDQQQVLENPRAAAMAAAGPNAPRIGPLELTAQGNVVIDGYDPNKGFFTALGHRAMYDQEKTMFVLEGDARGPASITHQQFLGAAPDKISYQLLKYWLDTGAVEAIQPTGQFQQSGLRQPPALPAPRR